MKTAGPPASASRTQVRLHGGGIGEPAIMTSSHIAASTVAPWNLPPGRSAPTHSDVDADDDPDRRQHPRQVAPAGCRVICRRRPRPPAPGAVRRQRPDADQAQQQHHLLEQRVHRAEGHQHGGDRVADARSLAMFCAAAGASVGGADRAAAARQAPSPRPTAAERGRQHADRQARPLGRGRRLCRRRRAAAAISSAPVRPAPIAASVMRDVDRAPAAPRPA